LFNSVIVEEMQKKRLGNSEMELTPIGVGAWAMGGGGWAFAWGPQDDDESISAIHAALDHGVNWIDTAAVYGLGHSEEVVARAQHGRSNRPYVFTKCARTWNEKREIQRVLKRDSVRRECEDSLRRLQVDVIDVYQIHWPEPDGDVEEGWEALSRLKEEGKVPGLVSPTSAWRSWNAAAQSRQSPLCSPPTLRFPPKCRTRNCLTASNTELA
jgi:aryl-alcohol dehydrogenase-like predicted oxidoreductase